MEPLDQSAISSAIAARNTSFLAKLIGKGDRVAETAMLSDDGLYGDVLNILYMQGDQSLRHMVVAHPNVTEIIAENLARNGKDESLILQFLLGRSRLMSKDSTRRLRALASSKNPMARFAVAVSRDFSNSRLEPFEVLIRSKDEAFLRGIAANPTLPRIVRLNMAKTTESTGALRQILTHTSADDEILEAIIFRRDIDPRIIDEAREVYRDRTRD